MRKFSAHALLFLMILVLTSAQNLPDTPSGIAYDAIEGEMLPHLFSTIIYPVTTATTTSTLMYQGTIPAGIFTTTQQIYYATALYRLSIASIGSDNTLYLSVDPLQISSSRTSYKVNLRFFDSETGSAVSSYDQIALSVFMVGSDFSGFSNTLTSTYVYAKNSLVETVDPGSMVAKFDFQISTTDPSPFAYEIGANLGQGCGAIRKNGNIIIETQLCQFANVYSFPTGFFIKNLAADIDVQALLNPASQFTSIKGRQATIFKSSTNPTVGLPLEYQTEPTFSKTNKMQVSMIFVGIRSFDASYPTSQTGLFKDTFIHNAGGVGLVASGGGSTLTTSLSNAGGSMSYTTPYGHAFCGMNSLITSTTDDSILDISANPTSFQLIGDMHQDAQCVFFESSLPCSNTLTQLVPSNIASTVITPATVTQIPTLPPGLTSLGNGITPTITTSKFSVPAGTTAKIIVNFTLPAGITEYEAFVGSQIVPGGNLMGNIQINGFGQTVLPNGPIVDTGGDSQQTYTYYFHNTSSTGSIVVDYTNSNALDAYVEIGLAGFNQVLNSVQCVTSCPNVTGTTVGPTGTTTPPTCLYCLDSENKEFKPTNNGECACKNHYYLDSNNICQPCSDPLCAVCTSSACTTCVGNATLGTSCACNVGFYSNIPSCSPCPSGCLTCTSSTSCQTCVTSVNANGVVTRDPTSPNCSCIPGYFDTGVAICSICSTECLTCVGSSTTCTGCNAANGMVLGGTTCTCPAGTYKLTTTNSTTCQPCSPICATCSISSVYCITCPNLRELTGTAIPNVYTCKCITGYIELQGSCVDQTCSTVLPYCQTCAYNYNTQTRQCLSCIDNRVIVGQQCKCKTGFFENPTNQSCVKCGSGCQFCTDLTSACSSCAVGSVNNYDGTCSCRAGTVLIEASGTLYCRPCADGCATCNGTANNCNSCNSPFILNNLNQCVCPVGTYFSPATQKCMACLPNCRQCVDGVTCDICNTNYVFSNSQCSLSCPAGTYNTGSNCSNCSQSCTSCSSPYICFGCIANYYLFAGSCRSQCPAGTFSLNSECLLCSSPCKTCSGSPSSCNSCIDSYIYLSGQCVQDCPPGTYYGYGSCLACNPSCLTCRGTSQYCVSCPSSQFLYNNKCFAQCPVAVVGGICTNTCPDGTYLSGNACLQCDPKCKTCSGSATSCTSCTGGAFSYLGNCVPACPSGTTPINSVCIPCDQSCSGCIGTSFTCIQCAPGYIRSGAYCIKNCPDGFFLDYSTSSCKACGVGCKLCVSLTNCLACQDPTLTPINGVCQKQCPPGAVVSSDGTCVCNFGVYHLGQCISSCPEGYYAFNKVCYSCNSPCLACSGSATSCLSCISGYIYNAATKTCTKASGCNYGQYTDAAGNCQRSCPVGFFLYKNTCVYYCPNGFKDNGYGGCVEVTAPTICTYPLFQQGNTCVAYCQVGYFPNQNTRVCDKCAVGCQLCLNTQYCLSCTSGFILNTANVCIQGIQCPAGNVQYNGNCYLGCPIGTYGIGQTCKAVCPQNTYYYNQYCYSTCPTNLRTPEACVSVCPSGYTQSGNVCQKTQ